MPTVTCNACHAALDADVFNTPGLVPCPSCQASTSALVFPAFQRGLIPGNSGEALLDESDASCFYHPQKKAAVHCDRCGRFLCALCDLALGDEHICPVCLEVGRHKRKLPNIEKSRVLYDSIALALVAYPTLLFLVCWMAFPLTAIAALVIAIRYWRAPRSIVQPSKARSIVAIVGAVLQLVAWTVVVILIIER